MASDSQIHETYSFIRSLQSDSRFNRYGYNALPLYAVALHLDIEELETFATDSLTDHPSDKKADIIYISEAEGTACVAQGYTGKDWGKHNAPANKASDLNTAAAWLLQTPIEKVPASIRAQAKLIREGLAKRTIRKVVFAYAHNALESPNVDAELETVRHLLKGLTLLQGAEIEVVELGLRRIEALYLTSLGSIQVQDQITLPAKDVISEEGPGWKAYVLSLNGRVLHDLYDKHKNSLFSANLRDFLGARKVAGNVNNRIQDTAQTNPGRFFVLNNGITIVTKKAVLKKKPPQLQIHGASVVNGAQTTGAVHAAGGSHSRNVSVLARIVMVDDEELIPIIVTGNNTQNSVVAWDRRSNDPVQTRIESEFRSSGVEYVHRRDNRRKAATSLFADQVGQMLCAFSGDLQTAIRAKADIFESDVTYSQVFPNALSIGHVFAVQTLGWAYDRLKQELKSKLASSKATDIEQRQMHLLDFPASKQFLIYVTGSLREEISGSKVSEPRNLELKREFITSDGEGAIQAWLKALRSIVPILVQSLPAEEYQVVRSTDHTNSVAKMTKGIIAGHEILQSSFSDIRKLLKPVKQ